MCGLAGFWTFDGGDKEALTRVSEGMARALHSRGPDSSGTWVDAAAGIGLGHTRLAVIDLTESGQQPMVSRSGRLVIAYNGEIYNARELRDELELSQWRGTSDTEVLLEACDAWGVEATLNRLNGMFAFVLFDQSERCLHLARDRVGIKPLYYGIQNGTLFFASQPKAILAHPDFRPHIDAAGLQSYLAFNTVAAPLSMFESLGKVMPGECVRISAGREIHRQQYWDLSRVVQAAKRDPLTDTREAEDAFEAILLDSVRKRMITDVPLGVFLSGGVDSSMIAALMKTAGASPLKTFTVGFSDARHDEAPYARAVAKHLQTDHTEVILGPSDALDIIPRIPQWYDEPFADSSQIPTCLVSRMAREHVTVCLSGDGGDELFAGYRVYQYGARLLRRINRTPWPARKAMAGAIGILPQALFDALPSRLNNLAFKLQKTRMILTERERHLQYQVMLNLHAATVPGWEAFGTMPDMGVMEMMQFIDTQRYLPNDILTKVDRASMAVSLEARVPLLDHRVVEFAWRLPTALRNQKSLLRSVLYKHVPRELIERPKTGFAMPVADWLRGPLREWATELLDPRKLSDTIDPEWVATQWGQHQRGSHDWQYSLWGVLMFQAWREAYDV